MLLPSGKVVAYTVLALAVWTLLCWIASVERRLSNLEEDVLIATTSPIIITSDAFDGLCGPCTTKFHVTRVGIGDPHDGPYSLPDWDIQGNLAPLPLELRAVPSFR